MMKKIGKGDGEIIGPVIDLQKSGEESEEIKKESEENQEKEESE